MLSSCLIDAMICSVTDRAVGCFHQALKSLILRERISTMHSLSLILAAAAIGLGLSVVDRTVNEPSPTPARTIHHTSFLPG
ncbi:hypothetical protein predicted by Glimmer/Critica [Acetobacter senegalensis]|uniref:Uncharacterized protein n=1 Tax=Acetobacter senegalensis TaxID=446692 RepID=A0A0U5EZN6_9PROT|nr:hypothetical protein predicted by Glimmer/Critica [Acetobacter senegalensis]